LSEDSAWFVAPSLDRLGESRLRRALTTLPSEQLQVTVLHVWAELTFAQIAEVLGTSANTVASRYRYALARLREALCVKEDLSARP
jgi:RNA polymerase sigma factor (sigma-70 family)